ncbi:methyltransferase TRM13 domain-containing protein [Ditylenchus destructor]|uniref:tRNA:m(4)X modification enzyme TRM13 n=1 Tax=Ditylenchus destructor TaxID=166010 RepID=A0AAD4N3E7_9BILA|nr:methyltransferase TRM13 domain-containing protein [Ditylenchus destructor]
MSQTELNRCAYVLPRKKRTCRMMTKPGKIFCGEHSIFDAENPQIRIPCPYDPKHTVNKSDLIEHLTTKCNARLPSEPYIVQNMNLAKPDALKYETGEDYGSPKPDVLVQIAEITERECKMEKLCLIKGERQKYTDLIEKHLQEEKSLGGKSRKHLIQLSSIIAHLTENNLILNSSDFCLIELGSGKAQLAYWLSKLVPKCKFLLLDRAGSRNKYDNKASKEDDQLDFQRIRCSIEHLSLNEVDMAKSTSNLTAVCKHFCGSATDSGIRCLLNAQRNGVQLKGFALAPCCHHRTEYSEFVGLPFLSSIGITSEGQFSALRHISTWALCKFPKQELSNQKPLCDSVDQLNGNIIGNVDSWSPHYKESLGRKARILLEYARAHYLAQCGFAVKMFEYVPVDISPENFLIIGTLEN